ncbi:MAG: DUF192 domain-containing protein [Bdellovibrionales bacterium]|nr:DUF192 domain-containing protein [Bdellovibrionales bacterium]
MQVTLSKTNLRILAHADQALTFWSRLRGLMFTSKLPSDHGLWIKPCNSVHTFFMKFPIDVIFLSDDLTIVEVYKRVKPFRITKLVRTSTSVLETNAGFIDQFQLSCGDQLRFAP